MYSTMALIDNVVTVYSTKTRIKTPFADKIRLSCNKSQYIPLKQGFFSIQNYELRIKNEGRNGRGVGWLVEFRATGCTLYIDFPFAKQPVRVEGLGGDAGAGAVFRRPSGLRRNGFWHSPQWGKMYFCEKFEQAGKRDETQRIKFFEMVLKRR